MDSIYFNELIGILIIFVSLIISPISLLNVGVGIIGGISIGIGLSQRAIEQNKKAK
jgi:hypothetical protein